MDRSDFIHLIGAEGSEGEYVPVACLLSNGYACAGYYNSSLNQNLNNVCVLMNARLVQLQDQSNGGTQATLGDFNEFLEEVVKQCYNAHEDPLSFNSDIYGKSIPLAAIPYDNFVVLYPVAHIGAMMKRVAQEKPSQQASSVPSFLDFDHKSVIVRLLRLRLW